MNDNVDWRGKLKEWLPTNPKTMPVGLRKLREEFVQHFPKEKLGALTLEKYALGHEGSKGSVSYWLEFSTKDLGRVAYGPSGKHGVWWSQKQNGWRWHKALGVDSAPEALAEVKGMLTTLVKAVEEKKFDGLDEIGVKELGSSRFALSAKPLYMYFPDEFLPINSLIHLRHFLHCFGEVPRGGLLSCNRQLLSKLRSLPEFTGFDTHQMMWFLYNCL